MGERNITKNKKKKSIGLFFFEKMQKIKTIFKCKVNLPKKIANDLKFKGEKVKKNCYNVNENSRRAKK